MSDHPPDALTGPGALYEIRDEDVRGTVMPVFAHRIRSLRGLLEETRRFANRTYLIEGQTRRTFGAHLRMTDALAAGLAREYGIQPGDRVAIYAANRWEWVTAFWAVTSVGAIPCAFNSWWTADEYAYALRLTGPALVIGDAPRLARASAAAVEVPELDMDTGFLKLMAVHDGEAIVPPPVSEDDPAVLIFSSGTTGRPKAVTVPHRAICGFAQVSTFAEDRALTALGAPVPRKGHRRRPSGDVVLVTSPLFHLSMLYGAALLAAVKGSAIVLLPGRFDPERVLSAIETEQVTSWLALGSAGPRVCASPALREYDTSTIRYLGIGGAPVSPAVQQALREAFPAARRSIGMGYTSTEAGAVIAHIAGPEYATHPTSTGRATVTTEIELRDADGRRVLDGHPGEVHVRSPYIMLGYWNDPEASAAVLKDGGWLAMGDIAWMEDGRLYLDSRARDMILVNAENVSPTEVEYRLEAHPGVLEAAVLAVDDAVTGDAVGAAVVTTSGGTVTSTELDEWCRETLASYKVPTRWAVLDLPLPRTASGKVLKDRLRDQME